MTIKFTEKEKKERKMCEKYLTGGEKCYILSVLKRGRWFEEMIESLEISSIPEGGYRMEVTWFQVTKFI